MTIRAMHEAPTWVTGLVADRSSGFARYAHLARAIGDPERTPRGKRTDGPDPDGRDRRAMWRGVIQKTPVEEHSRRTMALLADGQCRTFNRIGVELYDKTADNLFETRVDVALWALVERGELEHTMELPVFFRLKGKESSDG